MHLRRDKGRLLLHAGKPALLICLLGGAVPLGEGPPGRSSPGLAQRPAVGEPTLVPALRAVTVRLETRGWARPPSAGSSRQDTHTPPSGLGRACLAVGRPYPGLNQ